MSFAFEKKAVAGVVAALSDETTGLVAQLRVIETEESLGANALPDPEAIIGYEALADQRSPLFQVFWSGQECSGAEYRNSISGVDLTVGISYNSDSDLGAAAFVIQSLLQAVRMVLHADPTCGGRVGQAMSLDANPSFPMTYESVTRHSCFLGVQVRVHDP